MAGVTITGTISGIEAVTLRLDEVRADVRAAALAAVQRGAIMVQRRAKEDHLNGPRPGNLGVKTGRLRRSITVAVEDLGGRIEGRTGTNVAYGRVWELGFQGQVQVKTHQRKLPPRKVRTGTRFTYSPQTGKARKRGTYMTVQAVSQVRAHTRNVKSGARPFLRPALEETRAAFHQDLLAAVAKAAASKGKG